MDFIDPKTIGDRNAISMMERMLHKQFVEEVEQEITDMIMPKIKLNIKALAENAVDAWSIDTAYQMKMQGLGPIHEVMVKFTENIVNKYEDPSNPIVREVK